MKGLLFILMTMLFSINAFAKLNCIMQDDSKKSIGAVGWIDIAKKQSGICNSTKWKKEKRCSSYDIMAIQAFDKDWHNVELLMTVTDEEGEVIQDLDVNLRRIAINRYEGLGRFISPSGKEYYGKVICK